MPGPDVGLPSMQANSERIPVSTLIVDDEVLARNLLAALVRKDPELLLAGECADGQAALEAVRERKPDIVFLDVSMPGPDGTAIAGELARLAEPPYVIFVTAHAEHAVQAFELGAVDYLVKPLRKARFQAAVERAKQAVRNDEMVALTERLVTLSRGARAAKQGEPDRIELNIRVGNSLVQLSGDDVVWLEAANQYVEIHTDSRSYTVSESLGRYAEHLGDGRFFRIHRSAVVNASAVHKVSRRRNGTHVLTLRNGNELVVARSRASLVPEIMRVARRESAGFGA